VIYRLKLLEHGRVPPESGPARQAYLLEIGRSALELAEVEQTDLLAALALTPPFPILDVSGDHEADLLAATRMRADWDELKSQLPAEVLEAHEQAARRMTKLAVEALNFLEDTELADRAHALVDSTALLSSGLYGCKLWVEDGEVWTDCPIRMSHVRWGVSLEMTTEWGCSICNERFDVCPHDPSTEYEVTTTHATGSCSICHEHECEHEDGTIVAVRPFPTTLSISSGATAMVARPRYPRARATAMTLDIPADTPLYRQAEEGVLFCDQCRQSCAGLRELDWETPPLGS